MTTAENTTTPTVPVVVGDTAHSTIVIRRDNGLGTIIPVPGGGCVTFAAEIRGALADAYRAGLADGIARTNAATELDLMAARRRVEILTAELRARGWTTDNRWSPGASGASVPDNAPAAYSARWIDRGNDAPAEILADRQGFAYGDPADRERLIAKLTVAGASFRNPYKVGLDAYDRTTIVMNHPEWQCYMRRAGGYIYVDAWLVAD